MFAIRAIREVERELFDDCFGIGAGFDLDDNREVVSLGDSLLGKKGIVGYSKRHLDRGGALAGCDCDDLPGWCEGFQGIIDEGDLNLAIRGDEEFRVRFDGYKKSASVWTGDFLFMAMVFARMEREGAKDGDGERQDACGFHVLVFGELLLRKWP